MIGTIPRPSYSVGEDYINVATGGGGTLQIPRSVYDQAMADYNSVIDNQQSQIAQWQDILDNPNNPQYNSPHLPRSLVQSQIDQLKSNVQNRFNFNNMSPDDNTTFAGGLVSRAGMDNQLNADRSVAIKAAAKAADKAHLGKFLGTAGAATALVGGSILAPYLTSSGAFSTGSAVKGALGGAASGFASDGFKGALKGAALGGLTGGYGGTVGKALGLSGAGLSAFQGGLSGAAGGLANGDPKAALLGAGIGAGGGYLSGGGLGHVAGTDLGTVSGNPNLQGPTLGSGLMGSLTRNLPSEVTGIFLGEKSNGGLGGLGNLKSFIKPVASIYGGYQANEALDEAEKQQLANQSALMAQLQPYNQAGLAASNKLSGNLAAGFNPGDLSSDPGYQFRLAEGQKGLDRSLAATGMSQSGRAIKAAQQYQQGLAATEYGDAYDRWLAQNQQLAGQSSQGLNAATNIGNAYTNIGNVQSATTLGKAQNKNQTIASILAAMGLV